MRHRPGRHPDPDDCEGELHEFRTCEGLGFTVPRGRFAIRPAETCP